MGKIEEIREQLKQWANNGGPAPTMLAKVVSVNETNNTCVLDEDGMLVQDVRLTPVIDTGEGLTLYPKVNTWALAVRIENENDWYLIGCKEVFKYRLKINTLLFEVTGDGVKIEKGSDSLRSCMDDLFTQISALTVPCTAPGTPSGIPLNATAFNGIKTRVLNILK